MKTIHIREDPGESREPYKVLVTNYWTEPYEGSGFAYMLTHDGKVREYGLGHCSCYGPWEGGWDGEPAQFTEYAFDDFRDAVTGDRVTVGGISDLDTARRFLEECRE